MWFSDDVLLDPLRPAAGVVGDLESMLVQGVVHLPVVRQAEGAVEFGEISVEEAAPPPVSIRSNFAPFMVSMNCSFFSEGSAAARAPSPACRRWLRSDCVTSIRHAACCQQPA